VTLTPATMPHFPVLDGWRGISILLVLIGHLFPLGPKSIGLNIACPALGMAVFFTLSGFLITTTLLHRPSVAEFLIRRACRIVPLAWLFSLVALSVAAAPASVYVAQLLFYSNLPPFWLTAYTGHLWSLGVEMQFYLAIALIVLFFGQRGLWSLPLLCASVTLYRIHTHTFISIVTILRADEILVGGCLALLADHPRASPLRRALGKLNPVLLIGIGLAASLPQSEALNYLRPYFVALAVGATLFEGRQTRVSRLLHTRWLAYIAAISYSLYILHGIANWGWLGSGSKTIKYAKRIPGLLVIFGLAHLSTFHYEVYWIRCGKTWAKHISSRNMPPSPKALRLEKEQVMSVRT
jgi:peptidoglycan/LPS O-acetylase OafA/YrhL